MSHWNKNLLTSLLAVLVVAALISLPFVLRAYDDVKDPVCGMKVDPAKAQFKSEYEGKTYYFCSADCKTKFDANPAQYLKKEEKATGPGMHMMEMKKHEQGKEGCCEEMMKDVKFEVTNLPNGVQIKITSDKPEVVKKIQEMHKDGKGCCMMMKEGKK
jgi:YHS domain-containing protein